MTSAVARARLALGGFTGLLTAPNALELSTELGRSTERNRRATLTSLTGVGARFLSIAVSVVTIPILLRYLGVERYGVWLTISSGAAWLSLVQLGVAPSLINRLSATHGDDDRDLRVALTSTAWGLMIVIALIALLPLVILLQVAPWPQIFNIEPGPLVEDAKGVAAVVWVSISLGLLFSVPMAMLRAHQEGYVANALDVIGSLSRLATLFVLVALNVSMVGLAIGFTVVGVAFGGIATAFVFTSRSRDVRPTLKSFDPGLARQLLGTGASFTSLGLATMVIGYTDLIVISQVLGPAFVPTYSIAFALLAMFLAVELAILDAVWPAYSDAGARGARRWLEATHRRIVRLFVGTAILFGIVVVTIGQPLVTLWAGELVTPSFPLLVTIAVLAIVQAYQLPHGRMLTALGHVRTNSGLGILNAAINLPASILLVSWFGVAGAAAGSLLGYLVVGPFVVMKARRAIAAVEDRSAPDTVSAATG